MPSVRLLLACLCALASGAAARAEPPADEFDQVTAAAEETARATNRLLIPVPLVTPEYGAGLGVAAVWFYTPSGSERPWVTGGGAIASTNGSFAAAGVHQMAISDDRLRLEFRGAVARLNTRFFGVGGAEQDAVAITQRPTLVEGRAAMQVADGLLLGGRARFLDMRTTLRDPEAVPPGTDLSLLENYRLVALGPTLTFDKTDRPFAPRTGLLATAFWQFSLPGLGSDTAYNKLTVNVNRFFDLGPRTVLGVRGSLCSASGSAPFFDLCLFGANANLRGYESGRFRDHASWSGQAEVRRQLGRRLGAVAFAGVGGVAPGLGEIGGEPLLPAAGMGLRYEVARDYGVNLRLDVAVGRDSRAVYVSLGEAF